MTDHVISYLKWPFFFKLQLTINFPRLSCAELRLYKKSKRKVK
jgi:hypothetical protein